MKKILYKSISAFLAMTCFISFTFNGLTIASASVQSASIASGGVLTAGAASSINAALNSFQTDLFRGSASFSVPIAVPQGRRGIAPQLALSYSSQPSNGWCGVGWNLALGSIERSMKDGYPAYDDNDIFTYNGSELVKIGTSEYRLKTDGAFMKFTNNGTYWEVLDTAGTTYRFDSKISTPLGVYKWALVRVTDVHGNYMSVTYTTDQNQIYPLQIAYTGNDTTSLAPCYTVDFNLEARDDDIVEHLIMPIINTSGVPTVSKSITAYRLASIDVKYNSSLVRKYELDYKYSAYTKRSLLKDVTMYGSDGTTSLNPISFQYDETLPQIQVPTGNTIATNWGVPVMGDFNGDGINDICIALYEDLRVYWGHADGTFTDGGVLGHYPGTDAGDSHLATGDFNGDGYTDIFNLLTWGTGGNNYYLLVTLSNGSGFASEALWLTDSRTITSVRSVFVNDINKDGKADVMIVDHMNGQSGADFIGEYYLSKANQDGFETSNLGCNLVVNASEYNVLTTTGDFNRDGCMDLMFGYETESTYYPNTTKVVLYPDYLSPDDITPTTWISNYLIDDHFVSTDVNYDGFTDLVRFYPPSGVWDVAYSTGTAFDASASDTWCSNFGGTRAPLASNYATSSVTTPGTFYSSGGTNYFQFATATQSDKRADYLLNINNGVGGSVDISYAQYQESELPFVHYVVDEITKNDGMGNSYTINYEYGDAAYDRDDREFRGFNYAKVIDPDGNYSENYFFQDDIYKGKLYQSLTKDASGNLYMKKANTFAYTEPYTGVYNIYLQEENNYEYETQTTPRHTKVSYAYDSYGNVTNVYSHGDLSITGDEKRVITEYVYNTSNWIIGLPSHTYAEDYQSNKISEQWFYYDNNTSYASTPIKGLLTKQESWLATGANPTVEFGYDPYGNQTTITNALNRTTTTEYDTANYLFPLKVTNALGQEISQTYDPKTGQVLTSTDANDQTTINIYDVLGRLIKVIGPNDSETYPSVQYQYDLSTTPSKVTSSKKIDNSNYITTYSFYDGMGSCIQTKAPAENSQKQVVSGSTKYNSRGLVEENYFPYLVDTSSAYAAPDFNQEKTTYEYDPMGRLVETTAPDGTISRSIYEIGKITGILEFNSTELQKSVSLFDAYGQLTEKQEFNDSQTYTTTYAYDALGNLKTLTDNQNNVTTINYDTLGRKTSMDDPDMGVWSYSYDVLGNLISQTDAKNQTISFSYDELNRLFLKSYSASTQTVLYEYDNPTVGEYGIGRLYRVTDGSGVTEFYYDNIGREIKSEKTISGSTYTVERNYDALNRITDITYPDGEIVSYTFNPSGAIETVSSQYATYVSSIDYNVNGQMSHIEYGNSTYTDYEYNPQTLRLDHLSTNGGSIQDLYYTFDHKSNITNIADYTYGTNQGFEYDDLNRLTTAIGTRYGTINYNYDSIGNMIQKNGIVYQYGTITGDKPHAVTQYGDIALSYDPNGNMQSKGIINYDYDPENRLISVSDATPYPPTQQITLDLAYGWNFITIPVEMEDAGISAVLDPIDGDYDQVTRFNPQTQEFEHYVGNSDYNQFSNFECGKGYQIYITNSSGTQLSLSGTVPLNLKQNLKPGLNLLGNPKFTTSSAQDCLEDLKLNLDYDSIWKYDTATGTLINATQTNLAPGESVFINILKESIWTVNKQLGTTTFVYDGDGGRVKKIAPDLTTTYIGSLYEKQVEGANTKQINHIFLGSNRICSVNSQPAQPTIRAPLYYHSDHLGSSNVITDATGQVVQHTEYEPFGKVITDDYTTDTPTNYKFTGKELDNTELYFYSARYYDPDLCRFITADTFISGPGSQALNRYSYCYNNPVNYTDPSGHFAFLVALAQVLTTISTVATIASIASTVAGMALKDENLLKFGQVAGYVGIGTGVISMGINAVVASEAVKKSLLAAGGDVVDLGTIVIEANNNAVAGVVAREAIGTSIANTAVSTASSAVSLSALDKIQVGLDTAGCIDPTPVCDLTSGAISAFKGDWTATGCSILSCAPYVGDVLGKGMKYGAKGVDKVHDVYKIYNKSDEVVYIGRTSQGIGKRFRQHINLSVDKAKEFSRVEAVGTKVTKQDARILEQQLINKHGGIYGSKLFNNINSIAEKFWETFKIKR